MKCIPDNANTGNRGARNNSLLQEVEEIRTSEQVGEVGLERRRGTGKGGGGDLACLWRAESETARQEPRREVGGGPVKKKIIKVTFVGDA